MKNPVREIKPAIMRVFILGLVLIGFIQCSPSNDLVLTVINEMQPCEENNIFYRIIKTDKPTGALENARDSLVLFVFSDDLNTQENYDLLYPAYSEKRSEITVKGHFLDEKVGANNSYGCPGSSTFRITEIIDIKDVTEIRDYPINNQ